MIRVYNYMAAGVALTGVVAWLTYQAAGGDAIQVSGGQITGLTSFGQAIFQRPADDGSGPRRRSGLCSFMSFRHQPALGGNGADAVLRLCRPARTVAGVDLPGLYRRVDHAGVLHLGGDVRRHEPVRLHHAARSDRHRLVPVHGPDRHHHRHAGQYLPAVERARLGDLGDRRADLRRPHRLRHAEASRKCTARWTTAPSPAARR